jgi:cysteine desulfurase
VSKELFLDSNAHTPLSANALKSFINFNNSTAGHGHASSPSVSGRAASLAIEEARGKIAALLGAKASNQIIFTSTCTQACEWGMYILEKLAGDIFISPTEHPAISQSAKKYFPDAIEIKTNKSGIIKKLDYDNESVICIHVQNEIGIIQPIEKIHCKYLFSDMSQSAGKLPINMSSLSVDIATFGGHKFCGAPIGLLYLKNVENWKEFGTGSRYYLDRSGTPDAAGIVATAAALEDAVNTMEERTQNMVDFRDVIESGLLNLGFDIIGKDEERVPNTTFVKLGNGLGMKMLLQLGQNGIHVGLGSACGSMYASSSPLMDKLGIDGSPHDFMRISQFGEYGKKEANIFIDTFNKELSKGR